MIFDDFQQGIIDRLESDAFFTQSPEVVLLPEEDSDELTDEELALVQKRANDALNAGGVVGIVGEVDYVAVEDSPDMFEVTSTIVWFENRKKNRTAATGCRRSARDCNAKAHARLQRWRIPITDGVESSDTYGERVDPFSKLKISSSQYIGEEDGTRVRALEIKSRIAIGVLEYALATEDAFILVTENDEPLEVSPVNP